MDFSSIWSEYDKILRGFIFSRVRDKEITKDILQEVAIRIYQKLHTIKDKAKVKPWLFQVTKNIIIDYYKREKRHQLIEQEFEPIKKVDKDIEDLELLSCINKIATTLPKNYREVLELSEYKELSSSEISKELNISIVNTKARVQRAKKKLGSLLFECCEFEQNQRGEILNYKRKSTNSCEFC